MAYVRFGISDRKLYYESGHLTQRDRACILLPQKKRIRSCPQMAECLEDVTGAVDIE